MKVKKNARGFAFLKFKDYNGVECSIQKSSLATGDLIWLGADDIGLKQFVPFRDPSWKDVDTKSKGIGQEAYIANNRMHLTRKQVKKLLPILQKFVETGEIPC